MNKYRKIRPHLQKSSHLDFSPKIAIFVLSCKEIRRQRRRNGQAGARPCKRMVGDAGIGTEKASQTADIHQTYKCAGAPLSAQRSLLSEAPFFCRPSGVGGGLVITILQRLRTIPRTGSGKQFAANPREHERERSRKNGSSEGRPKKNGMDALWQQTFYTIGRCCKLFIIRIKFLSLYIIFEQPDHHGNPKRGRIRERLDKNIDRQ